MYSYPWIENTILDPWLVDLQDVKPKDTVGWLYIYWKKSVYKWTHTIQTVDIQEATVCVCECIL